MRIVNKTPNLFMYHRIYIVEIILLEDNVTEQEAIQRLKRGDIGGLDVLVSRYQVKAVRTAYLITREPALAEDVVQDCFVRVVRSIRGFDASRPFEPWFMRSVVNASVKVMQKSGRQIDFEDDTLFFAGLISRIETVEQQVETIDIQNEVWEAMQKLSPRQRAVIVQRYFLEMTEKEMALESGTATGTIKWLLNTARKRLGGLLAGRSDE